jgi:type I restriction enzyme S subunit
MYNTLEIMRYQTQSTGISNLNFTLLSQKKIVALPPISEMKRYDHAIKPFVSQMSVLRRQIGTLRSARDLLLPKLISGSLSVGFAEEALAKAAE